jgi:hypothetical protein
MVRITANEDFVTKLTELTEAAEVYDASGRLLGRFEPFPSTNRSKEGYCIPDFDESELARIEQQPDGRTLPEIWERLQGQ